VGKTTLARVLAMALNCENKRDDGEPCGECTSCRHIWSGSSSLDVVEIDAASNRGVDDARDLRERALYAPSGDDRYKVYIVDEAHMLTREAWNALLKILEEPPPRVVFVFATTDPQKILQAAAPVMSRLQRFDLKRIGAADIRARLEMVLAAEKVEATPDALAMISRAADGSMRDALSLADQVISIGDGPVTGDRVRDALGLVPEDEYLAVLDIIRGRRAAEVFPLVNRLGDGGVDFAVFLAGFADVLRGQLAVALGGKAESVSPKVAEALAAQRDAFSPGDLLRMLSAISTLEPNFRKSGQQQMLVEMLLVRLALIDRTVSIEDLIKGMTGSSGEIAAAPAASRAAPRNPAPTRAAAPFAPDDAPPPVARPPIERERNPEQLAKARDAMDRTAQSDTPQRITTEALKEERMGRLRKEDPALGAAIDALDLELLD
jgi:DNA polymerase-3 subunit gamma/tau